MFVCYFVDKCKGCLSSEHKPHAWGNRVLRHKDCKMGYIYGPITYASDSVWMIPGTVSPLDD